MFGPFICRHLRGRYAADTLKGSYRNSENYLLMCTHPSGVPLFHQICVLLVLLKATCTQYFDLLETLYPYSLPKKKARCEIQQLKYACGSHKQSAKKNGNFRFLWFRFRYKKRISVIEIKRS